MEAKQKSSRYDAGKIREAVRGRELDILKNVAGIPSDILDTTKREYPCPKCGGKTRFRLMDLDTGGVRCSHCFADKSQGNDGDFFSAVEWIQGVDFTEALQKIGDYLQVTPRPAKPQVKRKTLNKSWVYTDENGVPLYRVKRVDNGVKPKDFFQERYENGRYENGLSDALKQSGGVPLYLPEILKRKDEPLYIVEGEKCCDVVCSLGLLATTASGGSNNEKLQWSKYVQNRDVIILPDEDTPGYKYALYVADSLHRDNRVKVVFLPCLAEKEDIADWIDRGGTKDELLRIVAETPAWDGKPFAYSNGGTTNEPAKPTKRPALEWEPFPCDTFPKSLQEYIVESAAALNVDPAYVGPFALSTIASVIGSAWWIELKTGWREPAIIWAVTVATSGSGKSPGLDAATKPLLSLQQEADKRYKEFLTEFESAQSLYNADFALWKGNRKKNPGEQPPEKPTPPIAQAYLADDTTPEALVEILEQNPFGVCLPKDELSGWIGGFDAYSGGKGSKDLPFWLQMHGGRYYRANRKTGKKIAVAATPSVSVCGGIQPGMLRKILMENEHFFDVGLAARILFTMPPDLPQHWTEAVVSEATRFRYWKMIETILALRSGDDFLAPDKKPLNPEAPCVVTLSEPAKRAFIEFYNANADERAGMESETQKALWAKLTGYAARIALVFHVVRYTTNVQKFLFSSIIESGLIPF